MIFPILRKTVLYRYASRYPAVLLFVRYSLVGGLNVLVYLTLFGVLTTLHVPHRAALLISFLASSLQGFTLHKLWAFKDRSSHWLVRQYLLFMTLTVVGVAINQAVFTFVPGALKHDYGLAGRLLAATIPLPFSVVWNFFGYRRWTFSTAVA